jgi:hypothetical protein
MGVNFFLLDNYVKIATFPKEKKTKKQKKILQK